MWSFRINGTFSAFQDRQRIVYGSEFFSRDGNSAEKMYLAMDKYKVRALYLDNMNDTQLVAAVDLAIDRAVENKIVTCRKQFMVIGSCDSTWNIHEGFENGKAILEKFKAIPLNILVLQAECIHMENEQGERIENTTERIERVWGEMVKLKEMGYTKELGVANFNVSDIERLLNIFKKHPPSMYELSNISPYKPMSHIVNFCHGNDIQVVAKMPCAAENSKSVLKDPVVVSIATKLSTVEYMAYPMSEKMQVNDTPEAQKVVLPIKKTAFQVVVKWLLQRGIIVYPILGNDRSYTGGTLACLAALLDPLASMEYSYSPTEPKTFMLDADMVQNMNALSKQKI